jgi:hypothetical protein
MHEEKTSWEEDTTVITSTMMKPPAPPHGGVSATDTEANGNTTAKSSTSGETAVNRHEQEAHDAAHV